MSRIDLPSLLVPLVLLIGCTAELAEPVDGGIAEAAPHWATVGLRYEGSSTEPAQSVPPAMSLRVPSGQPFDVVLIAETHDYCVGEQVGEQPCCVSNSWPEVVVDGDAITVSVRVELSADVPCNGSLGPVERVARLEPLAPGRYRLVGSGRADVGIADIVTELLVE